MTVDITSIVVAVLGAIGTVLASLLTTYLVPWLKSKFTESQITTIYGLIEDGVKAAETLFPNSGTGSQKFQYVMDSVKTACEKMHMTFDETTVKNAIQAVWNDLYNKDNPAATQIAPTSPQVDTIFVPSKDTAPAPTEAQTDTQGTEAIAAEVKAESAPTKDVTLSDIDAQIAAVKKAISDAAPTDNLDMLNKALDALQAIREISVSNQAPESGAVVSGTTGAE